MKPLYPVAICGCIAALGLAHAVAALMPIAWTADGSDPAPKVITIGQGETRPLIATLRNYGAPVVIPATATAELYYQTNGMGSLYWSGGPATVTTGGVITATWSPALDAGARQYTFALGVDNNGARLYTAYGLIRMRTTPGAIVNALPLPAPSIDFATLDIRNAPWATPADIDAAIIEIDVVEHDPIATPIAQQALDKANSITLAGLGGLTNTAPTVFNRLRLQGPSPYLSIHNTASPMGNYLEFQVGGFYHGAVGNSKFIWYPPAAGTMATEEYADTKAGNTASAAVNAHNASASAHATLIDNLLPKTGGTMSGLLTTAPAGIALHGSGTTTNYILRAEYDGTNLNFNVYEVAR